MGGWREGWGGEVCHVCVHRVCVVCVLCVPVCVCISVIVYVHACVGGEMDEQGTIVHA